MDQQKLISNLNQTIRHLTNLLNIRMRTEFPESYQMMNEFNEAMIPIIKFSKHMSQMHNQQKKEHEDNKKNQLMEKRLEKLEQDYISQIGTLKLENDELMAQIQILQNEKEAYRKENFFLNGNQDKKIEEINNLKYKIDSLESDISKLQLEKSALKSQSSNLQSLMKQIKEEAQKNANQGLEQKFKMIKEDVEKVKQEYNRKIEEKDEIIEKLERELKLQSQEIELNSELKSLMNS